MKKLLIILLLLSHSFLAMAEDNTTKVELFNFIKEYNITVGSYYGSSVPSDIFTNLTIENFDKIDTIFFVDKNITSIPSTLFVLPNLIEIYIQNVNLETFPKLDNFTRLKLVNIDFDKIANDVFENTQLTSLTIIDSKITFLPSSIGNLINLTNLELENAQLKELPKEFENLVNLGNLNLNNNQIEKIPNTLVNLGYLYMNNNNLKELPENFGDNSNLRELYLSNNNLKTLPDSFLNLKELRFLYLNNNQIEKLPKNFFSIFEIVHPDYFTYLVGSMVNISNNKISFFDKSICEAYRFNMFYFWNDYFGKLPNCLLNDENLTPRYFVATNDINGSQRSSVHQKSIANFLQQIGWKFSEDIIIYYTYEDNKIIKFEPIYQKEIEIDSYLWNFGDGNTSTEETPTHIYSNYGDYNVTLTVNEDTNFSKLITVYPRVLELKKGWNMITPPTKDDVISTLFREVWSYENSKWNNSHRFLIPTIGYWVRLNEDLNYSYSGEVYSTPSYKIKDGWNLIGNGEKMINFDENSMYYIFRDNSWIKNPKEIKSGEGVWIKK